MTAGRPDPDDRARTSGRFLVTNADADSAVLSNVEDGQVCPLAANPGVEAGDVVEATLAPEGPLGVTWRAVELTDRWHPTLESVEAPPGERARELAAESEGRLARTTTEDGALDVLAVDPERTAEAVADVCADETTRRIAARRGARRVEVRGADGVVAIHYRRDP